MEPRVRLVVCHVARAHLAPAPPYLVDPPRVGPPSHSPPSRGREQYVRMRLPPAQITHVDCPRRWLAYLTSVPNDGSLCLLPYQSTSFRASISAHPPAVLFARSNRTSRRLSDFSAHKNSPLCSCGLLPAVVPGRGYRSGWSIPLRLIRCIGCSGGGASSKTECPLARDTQRAVESGRARIKRAQGTLQKMN